MYGSYLNSISFSLGHKEVVQFLIEKGANIESKNKFESTPLGLAAYNGIFLNQIEKLLKKSIESKFVD